MRDTAADTVSRLDRARVGRALLDLAPNAWMVSKWVAATAERLLSTGYSESALARLAGSLIERLRVDLEGERDRLALEVFGRLLAAGRIEFRLRADALDYDLPSEVTQFVSGNQ